MNGDASALVSGAVQRIADKVPADLVAIAQTFTKLYMRRPQPVSAPDFNSITVNDLRMVTVILQTNIRLAHGIQDIGCQIIVLQEVSGLVA